MKIFPTGLMRLLTYPFEAAAALIAWFRRLSTKALCCLVLLAALGWSSGSLLTKVIHHDIYATVGARATIYWLFMGLYLARREHLRWPSATGRTPGSKFATALKHVLFSNDPWHYVCGVFGALNLVLSTHAILLSKGGMATFLNSGAVAVLAVARHLGGKPLSKARVAVVFLSLSGMLLLGMSGLAHGESKSILLGVVSMFTFSIFLYASGERTGGNRGTEIMESWALVGVITSLCLFPLLLYAGLPRILDVVWIATLGVLTTGVADLLYLTAVSARDDKMGMLPAYIISRVSPVLAAIWVGLVLQEVPPWPSMLGGGTLIAAAMWQILLQIKEESAS